MSGETGQVESGWTTDTLKGLMFAKVEAIQTLMDERDARYQRLASECDARDGQLRVLMDERDVRYSQRFTAQQEALVQALAAAKEAVAAALLAADRAVTKAELASEKRFESVNEFRGALSDQTSKLLPRVEADQRFHTLFEAIGRLEKAQNTQAGADTRGQRITATGLTVAGIVMTVVLTMMVVAVNLVIAHK